MLHLAMKAGDMTMQKLNNQSQSFWDLKFVYFSGTWKISSIHCECPGTKCTER